MTHCCDGTCDQGRRCPHSLDATRCALWLAPLHQNDGGHRFSAGVVFPLTDNAPLAEVPTPIRRGGLMAALRELLHI